MERLQLCQSYYLYNKVKGHYPFYFCNLDNQEKYQNDNELTALKISSHKFKCPFYKAHKICPKSNLN